MSDVLLQVNSLGVSYTRKGRGIDAVIDVNFSLSAGSTIAIIGASGSGKSSLALALAGLHDRSKVDVTGTVLFQGVDVLGMAETELDSLRGGKIGMIFQDPRGSLDPTMKIERQVVEAIRLHREVSRREAVADARQRLRAAGISERIIAQQPYAFQLSSGLCQRAVVAIALAGDPLLLIADEPTGALDLTRQAWIISLLQQQVKENRLGMIFVTHDISIAAVIADNLMVMHQGRVVEYGSCKDVLAMPQHERTAAMLHAWHDDLSAEEGHVVTS